MNKQIKAIFVLAFTLVMSVTSCLNEVSDPNGGGNALPGNVESLDSQVAAMKISVGDLESVSGALVGVAETLDVDALKAELESCSASVQDHIASVESGAQAVASTLKALELQAEIAQTVGALKAQVEMLEANGMTRVLTERIQTLEEGVASWLGDKFENYYLVSSEQVRANELGSIAEDQSLSVDALQSDVEAGLRVGDATEELAAMAKTVGNNSQALAKLSNEFGVLSSEVKEVYSDAIKSSDSDTKSTLKSVNTKAAAALKSSTPTLDDLAARITALEKRLDAIESKLTELETNVEELLSKIQSITFVSEYSDEKAVAYYSMTDQVNVDRYSEGKLNRVPEETFNLTFLVRPAAAADALAQTWQESLSVVGYYANRIQQQATVNIQSFDITNAVATHGKGLLTVTVNNAFDDEFYFKEKGAMLALSVESGKNNCASKFVEIVPRDISGKVYAESIKLTPTTLSLQNGDVFKFVAEVTPSNVTDQGFVWEDYDSEYFTVDENGQLTATAVGKSDMVVTANATDEFGRQLSATCNVTVTPAIRIVGPQSVEIGKSAVMEIESPNYINPTDVTWELEWAGNSAYLALTDNKDATCTIVGVAKNFGRPAGASDGASSEYLPINVKCTIGGNAEPVVLMHSVCVVEVQPRVIVIDGLANDQNKMTVKIGSTYQFNSSIEPAGVKMDLFGIIYQSGSSYVATIDFRSGLLTTVGYGTANISVEVNDKTSESYFYPKRELFQKFERVVAVTVEPYWVKTMTLPATYKMAPEATTTLAPEWTTDVDGVTTPSDQTLIWSSSDPTVVSVDANTGALLALKEGTATITATTAGVRSVPEGQEQISSSCLVTVETPTVPIYIGDYYYSDGTWSTERDNNKTVIGVVFAKVDATGSDLMLRRDYPNASHGLVVSLTEFSNKTFGEFKHEDVGDAPRHIYTWIQNNYDKYDIGNVEKVVGYTNSLVLNAYREAYSHDSNYCPIFDDKTGLAAQLPAHSSTTASHWYIPSYKEMSLLREALNDSNVNLNDRLQIASGTRIDTSTNYWLSSMYVRYTYYNDTYAVPYSMSTGGWSGSQNVKLTQWPVRVVLAF